MNTMNMPGFTAEASLYKTSGHYQTGRQVITLPTQMIGTVHLAAIDMGEVIEVFGEAPMPMELPWEWDQEDGTGAEEAVRLRPVADRAEAQGARDPEETHPEGARDGPRDGHLGQIIILGKGTRATQQMHRTTGSTEESTRGGKHPVAGQPPPTGNVAAVAVA